MAQQELKVNISGDSSKLNSALSSASSKLSAFGSKMQNVGKSMTTRLTLPLVAVGAASLKMAFDFDKSMTSITALVGVGADEVAKMGDAAKRMAVDTGKSANEAAEALFFITSAGLRGEKAMGVLEASLKAAAVGLGETKTIADLSTSALNAYGEENLSASGATDILTAAVREGKLEASQLAGAMGGVIPIASNMGVRFDEVAAAMAAMSRTGTNAAEGATQLNAILASLKKPTTDAEMAFQKMGMSTESVQKSLSEQGLLATLEMLQNGLKQTGQDTTAIFPNIRALKGVLDLTGAGLESNRQIFDSLTKSMGATDEAFEKTSKSASFKMTKSLNAMKASLIEVGNVILVALVPAVEKIAGFLTNMSDKFKSLSPTMQNAIVGFAGILAIAGPLIIIFGKLAVGISALGPLLPILASGFRLLTAAMIANPILAVAAAIAAIGIAIYSYTKAQKDALKESLTIGEIEEKIAEKRKKLASEQQKIAEGYGGQTLKNVEILKEEILALKQKEKAIKATAKALEASATTSDNSEVETEKKKNTELLQVLTDGQAKRREAVVGNSLEMAGIQDVMNEAETVKILENNAANAQLETQDYEGKKQRFLGFMMAQEEASQRMQRIGSAIDNSFGAIGGAITNMFGGAQSAMGAFVGTLAKDALKVVSSNLKIALSGASTAATQTAASFGPAAAFVLPALLAGATALISGSFAKFADGGIVSGPTMGLVGEYPGAKSNPEVIAPLNKLQGMIGNSGGSQNINVGGQIRLEGQDLLIAIQRAQETADRLF